MKENKTNILFICGSLAKGKDGVGDYTFRLASELINNNSHASIIAIHDKFVAEKENIIQDGINIFRLPNGLSLSKKLDSVKEYIQRLNPDYISLQFVPFAFHKRGLPLAFINHLSRIKDVKWHIMFHELWVGMEQHDTIKLNLWGRVQYHMIKQLIKQLNPKIIHSSNPLYIVHLKKFSMSADIKVLPLFGNIERKFTKNPENPLNKEINIILFAGIHYGAPVKEFIEWVLHELYPTGLIMKITFIGKNGPYLKEWTTELERLNIKHLVLGVQENDVISKAFVEADLGISTTPYYLSGKSGSVAAMLEHNLPVICVSRKWIPKVTIELSLLEPKNITLWNPELKLDTVLNKETSYHTLERVSEQFINDLSLGWHP